MEREQKGFTIIELLVAMAILGLLIGLLIPGIGILRRGQRDTARRASLQSLQAEVEEHFAKYKAYPTSIDTSGKEIKTMMVFSSSSVIDGTLTYKAVTSCSKKVGQGDMEVIYTGTATSYSLKVCLEAGGTFELK